MSPDKASNKLVNCTRISVSLVTGDQYEYRSFISEDSLRVYRTTFEGLGLNLGIH